MNNKIKLLIVDDLEDNRLVLMGICRKQENIQIIEATNGQEAVDICRELRPEIVLMDMMMPVMNGHDATKIIKSEFPDTIVIVVTAMVDQESEELMIKSGATAYIHKPINREMFFYKIKNYINLIKIKSGNIKAPTDKKAFNPFSKEIRSFKTIFQIQTADDMMDLGMWLLSWCETRSEELTYLFDIFVGFMYANLSKGIKNSETTTLIIEEGFDDLYISIIMDKEVELVPIDNSCVEYMRDYIIAKENTIYAHLSLAMLKECIQAKIDDNYVPHIEETTYKPVALIRAISNDEKQLIRKSFEHKTSAAEYIEDIGGDVLEEIEELVSVDASWVDSLDTIKNEPTVCNLVVFADSALNQYTHALNRLLEFSSLGLALDSLRNFIKNEAENILQQDKCNQLVDLLVHLGEDLASWRKHIFVDSDTADIHYLDSSFLVLVCR
jgi:two-component system chemotaxis response regulator CheY